jgi:hypothetical protein
MSTSLENLNLKIFREHLNTSFKVQDGGAGTVQLQLIDAVEGNSSPEMELFSLYFRGPFTPQLAQQTHPLQHEKLGRVEIFLTSIEADQENGTTYEAVFHRFRKS